jgi:hypothetical protein
VSVRTTPNSLPNLVPSLLPPSLPSFLPPSLPYPARVRLSLTLTLALRTRRKRWRNVDVVIGTILTRANTKSSMSALICSSCMQKQRWRC